MGEIGESLSSFGNSVGKLFFLPNRGNFTRGIFAVAYTKYNGSLEEAKDLYGAFFQDAAFTHMSDEELHLKQVVNTNQCHIHLHKHEDLLKRKGPHPVGIPFAAVATKPGLTT